MNAAAKAVEKAGDKAADIVNDNPEGAKAIMDAAKTAATESARSVLSVKWKDVQETNLSFLFKIDII